MGQMLPTERGPRTEPLRKPYKPQYQLTPEERRNYNTRWAAVQHETEQNAIRFELVGSIREDLKKCVLKEGVNSSNCLALSTLLIHLQNITPGAYEYEQAIVWGKDPKTAKPPRVPCRLGYRAPYEPPFKSKDEDDHH